MTPVTELPTPPAPESPAIDIQAVEPQQPGTPFTLYALANDLVSLLSLREEMAEAQEDTAEVEKQISAYVNEYLPQKVDAFVHVFRAFEAQEELATKEIARLTARRRQIASAIERLKQDCGVVLEQLPKPKRGSRKLEGSTATLMLKTNGGLQELDIYNESLVPDQYCTAEVNMPWPRWESVLAAFGYSNQEWPGAVVRREPDRGAIRAALKEPCWACEGHGNSPKNSMGEFDECLLCGGSGKQTVPGARLLERGAHLEIK